jgi:hypothetical protein
MSEQIAANGDFATIQEWFHDHEWTDGLPVVPPTEDAVDAMLAAAGVSPDEELGSMPPLKVAATAGKVAVNAVMAGCKPEYFPTLLTAVRGMLEPEFNLYTIQSTTHPVAPLVVVHGPEARRIGVNGKTGAFGPGFRANATIGRAIRLTLMNLGGGRPGVRDFATLGTPGKYSLCIAENTDDSPWPEYHTTRGLTAETSAVTVLGVEGPQGVNDHESTTPERNLDIVASVMGHLGSNNWYASDTASDIVVVLAPEHALLAAEAGWDRRAVQRYLYHASMRPVSDLKRGGQWDLRTWSPWMNALALNPEARIPIVEAPECIMVLVAGGPGRFSAVLTTMGNITRSVTLPIRTS